MARKLQKPNNGRKTQIYVFRGITVQARVTNLEKPLKPIVFVFTQFVVFFNFKLISIESVFISYLTFINPQNEFFGLKSQKKRVISLYWFAAHLQTSTLRGHKSRTIYSKFSLKLSHLTPSFQNLKDWTQKLQKPNNTRKKYKFVIRSLRVKARLTNLKKYLKPSVFVFVQFMVVFNLKKITIKSVFTGNLTFINNNFRTRSSV